MNGAGPFGVFPGVHVFDKFPTTVILLRTWLHCFRILI